MPCFFRPRLLWHLLAVMTLPFTSIAQDEPQLTPLGLYGEIRDLVLPGSQLEPVPLTAEAAVVVRIVEVRPHGDAFRYDIDYYGLEAGKFDLRTFLQRSDGSSSADLPEIPVEFDAKLAADRLQPNPVETQKLPSVGGYKLMMILFGVLWVLVLLGLIFAGRFKTPAERAAAAPPPTHAERLKPLLTAARDGELDETGKAELERSVYGFWRERLDLADESPATALTKLRNHEDAAPLVKQIERWLHAPNPESPADLDSLLEPYQKPVRED